MTLDEVSDRRLKIFSCNEDTKHSVSLKTHSQPSLSGKKIKNPTLVKNSFFFTTNSGRNIYKFIFA